MSEEAQPSEAPEVASLDDVINEFGSFEAPKPAEPAPVESPRYEAPRIDPFNEDQVNNYFAQQSRQQTALQASVQTLNQKLSQYEQREEQRRVEADIKDAVGKISKKIDGADPIMTELYLEKRARESEGFRKIWENRHSKPEALNKALEAISVELKDKFSVKSDPQLVENQRAMSQSQSKSVDTRSESPLEEKWDQSSEAERNRLWQSLKSGG